VLWGRSLLWGTDNTEGQSVLWGRSSPYGESVLWGRSVDALNAEVGGDVEEQ
jgi:hypothetical protein